jgi:hypothetical protein
MRPGNGLHIEGNPDLTDRQRRVIGRRKETQRPEMTPSGGEGRTGFGNTVSKGTDSSHTGYEDPHTGHLSGPGALSAM